VFRNGEQEDTERKCDYFSYTTKVSKQVKESIDDPLMDNLDIVSINFGLDNRIFDIVVDFVIIVQTHLFIQNLINIHEIVLILIV
jgi:hypothetical protein